MKQGDRRKSRESEITGIKIMRLGMEDLKIKSLVAFCFGLDFDFKGVFLSEEGDVKSDRQVFLCWAEA